MRRGALRQLVLAAAMAAVCSAAFAQAKPVVLRFVSDFPPPPHPAGLAMKYFAERLPQVIPGSEARLYYAGALYTDSRGLRGDAPGQPGDDLDADGQGGAGRPVDDDGGRARHPDHGRRGRQPGEDARPTRCWSTAWQKQQAIKVFGAGHMSFGMGVGGKKRYLKPDDFTGRKVRSMGPVENPSLESWKANPVVMAFGEVPSALESGVIDGLMTSIGGWLSVREQAPFYTTGGAGRVHRRLLHGQREPALVGPPEPGRRRRRSRS